MVVGGRGGGSVKNIIIRFIADTHRFERGARRVEQTLRGVGTAGGLDGTSMGVKERTRKFGNLRQAFVLLVVLLVLRRVLSE